MSSIPPDPASAPPAGQPTTPAAAPAAGRGWRRAGQLGLLLLGTVVAVLSMAWLAIHWVILPHIQQWRGWVGARAGAAIGAPVRIGRIEVRTAGWVPSFELQEVTIADADGRPAVRLPRVWAAVSPASLLNRQLDFTQLLIDGPELDLRRDRAGHVHIGPIDLGPIGSPPSPGETRSSPFADWLFRQAEVIVRNGRLRWTDEQRGDAVPLEIGQLQFVARNGLRHHDLRLDATPPAAFGERFSVLGRFEQPLLATPGDWGRWTGTVYADLPRADVGGWQRRFDVPGTPGGGAGSVRAWIEVADGRATGVTADLSLAGVSLQPGPGLKPLTLTRVAGRLIGRRGPEGGSVEARQFRFETGDGVDWRGGDLTFAWRQRDGQPVTGGSLSADHLDIGLAARIAASWLPAGDGRQALLADWRPEGLADRIEAHWDQPPGVPLTYRVKGRLSGVSLAAGLSSRGGIGRPGVRRANIDLDAGEAGGTARLELIKGRVDLPGVFEDPQLLFDRLGGRLDWTIEPPPAPAGTRARPGVTVQFRDVRFANADAHGRFEGRWSNARRGAADGGVRRAARAGREGDDGVPDLGRLELDGRLDDGVASRLHRYLPLALPPATRAYLRDAVQAGRLTTARVRIRGDLRRFPFFPAKSGAAEGAAPMADGEFSITGHVDDLRLAYVPGPVGGGAAWPVLTEASADLALEQGSFHFRNARGRTGDVDWDGIQGAIGPLGGPEAVLNLEAAAAGPLAEMLRLVNASPVGSWLNRSLAEAAATGRAGLQLTLGLPLLHIESGASVHGSLTLAGDNDLRVVPGSPLLGQARGRVDFGRSGFSLVDAGARIYGGESVIEGGTRPDGSVGFSAHGKVTAEGLRQAAELGPVPRFATALTGQTAYRTSLAFARGRPQVTVESDLVGVAIDLPAPLGKPAGLPLALRYQTKLDPPTPPAPAGVALAPPGVASVPPGAESAPPGVGTGPLRETLEVTLGDRLEARYLREVVGDSTRVLRGGIGVRAAVPVPASGVAAHIRADRLDADAWQAVFDRMFPDAGAAGSAPTTGADRAPAADTAADRGYQPDTIALQVDDLKVGWRRLTHLDAGLSQPRLNGPWRVHVTADQLAGYVEYRAPSDDEPAAGSSGRAGAGGRPGPAGRVYARLSRLVLPRSDAEQVSNLLDQQPASLPSLDVVVDDLQLNGLALGRVEVQASNRPAGATATGTAPGGPAPPGNLSGGATPPGNPSGGATPSRESPGAAARDWRLTRFTITTPEAQLLASGRWAAPAPGGTAGAAPAPRTMLLDFELQVGDSGALLERLGIPRAIKGGKGELAGQLAWQGSPFGLDYPSLSGQVRIQIDQGQFLKVDPGAARLLGVLSLQSLPRRLTLDFRDLFDRGFAFDEISGDVSIARGVARSRNLRMRGVQAAVLMEGSADIERETEDMRVVVVPEINAGTAALAYAVINPVIGIGALVAQVLLKKPLAAAGTREFHVIGPWADPKVLPVARRRGVTRSEAEPGPVPDAADAPEEADAPDAAASGSPVQNR